MTREDVERINTAMFEAWDRGDVDGIVGLLADEFSWRDVTLPAPLHDADDVRSLVSAWLTAFPDLTTTEYQAVVGEDAVASDLTWTGTNSGALAMGGAKLPPTGRRVVGRGALFMRIGDDGRITDVSSIPDVAGLMAQLGTAG